MKLSIHSSNIFSTTINVFRRPSKHSLSSFHSLVSRRALFQSFRLGKRYRSQLVCSESRPLGYEMRILLASRGFAQTAQQSLATHVANGEENGMADPEIASRPQVKAFIGLGSNVGDRFEMIESACREMEKLDIRIHKLSHLYETKAMYVEDQAPFLNGVCEVSSVSSTSLSSDKMSTHFP